MRWLYLDLSNPTLSDASALHSAILRHFDPLFVDNTIDAVEFFNHMNSMDLAGKSVIVFDETDIALQRMKPGHEQSLDNRFWEGMTLVDQGLRFLIVLSCHYPRVWYGNFVIKLSAH